MKARLALLLVAAAGLAFAEDERLPSAKSLFFDRKYAEAREAWQAVLGAGGAEAEAAAYWIARCSENLGEDGRALREYAEFLSRRPADRALADEARTSRVGLATRLFKAGQRAQLSLVRQGLQDESQAVRYFAAFQLASLGPAVGRPAVPVLKKILAEEKDEDLVDRAKLALLRVAPEALGPAPAAAGPSGKKEAVWLRLRIFKKGEAKPRVAINLPVALAEMVFQSLPEDTRADLRRQGYDADSFWSRVRKLGPTQILDIEGEQSKIQIWVE